MRKTETVNKDIFIRLFEVYSAIFLFSSINREFLLFGLDLRYITILFGILLLVFSKGIKKESDKKEKSKQLRSIYIALVVFFSWALLSNISWLWNGLEINMEQMIGQNILLANNLLAIFIYRRFREYVDVRKTRNTIIISCSILVMSFILTGLGFSLSQISGSDVRSQSVSTDSFDQKNIFGGDFRLAGYAEDANYASLFMLLGVVSVICSELVLPAKYALGIVFAISFGFACSKTLLVALPFCTVCGVLYKYKQKTGEKIRRLSGVIVAIVVILGIIMPRITFLSDTTTMSTRFKLWGIAKESFEKSPIVGNGISSGRSAINLHYRNKWYVQTHSTIWQILSEMGIVGLALYVYVIYKRLCLKNEPAINKTITISTMFLSLTYEIAQLQIFILIFYILPLDTKESEKK